MRDLLARSAEQLAEDLAEMGQPRYRAGQLYGQLHRGVPPEGMLNLPKALRAWAQERREICDVALERSDGETRKILFRMGDGAQVEGVLMSYKHGVTMCLSTQVGCRMGCAFCASTLDGCQRNLTRGEMAAMVCAAHRLLGGGAERRIGNLVLMGSGEPLDNYDETVGFLRLIHHGDGMAMGWRSISLSTCGLAAPLRRFIGEDCPVILCVSLHAPDDELRAKLMPAARANPLQEIMGACREYIQASGRRVIFEYALIDGVNDDPKHARSLSRLIRGMQAHVNVIPVNPVPESGFRRPGRERVEGFVSALRGAGTSASVRRLLGEEIEGACGQLRRRVEMR